MPNIQIEMTPEQCNDILRAMVEDIGSAPQQDPHFDYWHYDGQLELWGIAQTYQQAVIRKYVDKLGGHNASLALGGPMDLFMAACGQL